MTDGDILKRRSKSAKKTARKSDDGFETSTERTSTSKGKINSDSDSSSDEQSPLETFSRMTRSGSAVMHLVKRIKRVMDNEEEFDINDIKCIVCCDKKKSTILLPCRHQHTCDACWALWCVECMTKVKDISFNESDDTKPICPLCKQPVDDAISAIN